METNDKLIGRIDGVELDVSKGIARLTLCRPTGNRFSWRMLLRLHRVLNYVHRLEGVRVVWLEAEGADFSHGVDLRDIELAEKVASGEIGRREVASLGQNLITCWRSFPVPTMVSARGHVVGAGGCFFMAADFRIAAPGTRVTFPEIDRGMHLSWGILPILQKEVGINATRRLAILAEEYPVEEFAEPVCQIVPDAVLNQRAQGLADTLAGKAPLAMRAILSVLRSGDASNDDALFAETIASRDFIEAMTAWSEKRTPSFSGR